PPTRSPSRTSSCGSVSMPPASDTRSIGTGFAATPATPRTSAPTSWPARGCARRWRDQRLILRGDCRSPAQAQIEALRTPSRLDGVAVGAAGRVGLGRCQGSAGRPAAPPQPEQPPELDERLGVVVDADVEVGKVLTGGEHHGGRLPATPVAALPLARLHRRPPALRQVETGMRLECLEGGGDDRFADEHVAGHGEVSAGALATPLHAVSPGPGCRPALGVDRVHLAQVAALVAGERALDCG